MGLLLEGVPACETHGPCRRSGDAALDTEQAAVVSGELGHRGRDWAGH